MTLLVAALLPVLVMLGFWQLDRAADKRRCHDRYVERLSLPPQEFPADLAGADFLRVRLDGGYRAEEQYLVDNRVRDGRPGYWVVTRFLADDGRVYLVNRGWVAAPARRDELPRVPAPAGRLRLMGVVWPDTGLPPLLAPDPWPASWPKRVQRLDVARMAGEGEAVVAAEVRLEPGQPGVLAAAPLAVDFAPQRHQGYAVQWFGLAVVLAVGYLVFGYGRS
jgi:cytochrome oxidase assembly protein ShyY1